MSWYNVEIRLKHDISSYNIKVEANSESEAYQNALSELNVWQIDDIEYKNISRDYFKEQDEATEKRIREEEERRNREDEERRNREYEERKASSYENRDYSSNSSVEYSSNNSSTNSSGGSGGFEEILEFIFAYPSFILIGLAGYRLGNYDFPYDWILRLVLGIAIGFGSFGLMKAIHEELFFSTRGLRMLSYLIEIPIICALPIYAGVKLFMGCYYSWEWGLIISLLLPLIFCGGWAVFVYQRYLEAIGIADITGSQNPNWTKVSILLVILFAFIFGVAYTSSSKKDKQIKNIQSKNIAASQTFTCTANNLKIRIAPSTSSKAIGSLDKGQTVKVFSMDKDWAKIDFQGKEAYISSKYIAKSMPAGTTANNNELQVKKPLSNETKKASSGASQTKSSVTTTTQAKKVDEKTPTQKAVTKFSYGAFLDSRDGKEYKTIKIGSQTWLAENLAYLPKVSPGKAGENTGPNVGKNPHYYVYGYNGTNVNDAMANPNYKKHGVLYNWSAAIEAVPEGWHIPSSAEWNQLASFIGSEKNELTKISDRTWGTIGRHLKAANDWLPVSGYTRGDALDSYGLGMLPSGTKSSSGSFDDLNKRGAWWSSTSRDYTTAWGMEMTVFDDYLVQDKEWMSKGLSIRCLKDE